jgi:hypothetical protein
VSSRPGAPSLSSADVCREQLIGDVEHTVGLPESGDQEPRTTNVADHGHDLNGVPICVLLAPFAEEKSESRGAGGLCNEPMIQGAARWLGGWAGMVVWSGWAACPTHVVPALVAFALCNLGVRSTYDEGGSANGYWNGEVV